MAYKTRQGLNSPTFTPPPLDGSLSLLEIFDFNRINSANHPLFLFEEGGTVETITWSHAVRAVHTAARYVQQICGDDESDYSSTVVAILANTDTFSYFVLVAGIIRAGCQAFPISPRNSPASVIHLLQVTKSKYLFVSHDPSIQRLVATLACAGSTLRDSIGEPISIPTFEYLFGGTEHDFEPLPPMKPPEHNRPTLILHSTGTMSHPRPIPMASHQLVNAGLAPYFGDRDLCGKVFACHSLVMFHAIGCIMLPWTMASGLTIASFSPRDPPAPPNPDRVFSGAVATHSHYIFCVPSYIESWSRVPHQLAELNKFHGVIYSGAPLQKEIGDLLVSKNVNIIPCYGATEVGPVMAFVPVPKKEAWEYFEFSPHCRPVFIPYQGNIFQLLFLECPTHAPSVFNADFHGYRAYNTLDLVVPHPTDPNLWRIYGRADEQLMHSNGEKTNPIPIESMLARHPKIQFAVMFGRGRFHAGVIIQPKPEYQFDTGNEGLLAKFRNDIWPLVERVNDYSPTHSRLFKEMILVASPLKPFQISAKNTPLRMAVLTAYQEEIKHAYVYADEFSQPDIPVPEIWEWEECLVFVRCAVRRVFQVPVSDDEDIFQAGCDSLQATWIRNTLLHALQHSANTSTFRIPQNFVYANPTIQKLGTYILHVVVRGQSSVALMVSSRKITDMERLVQQYSTNFPCHQPSGAKPAVGGDVILLTGSTGFLGSHILEQLERDPSVQKIYALNRKDIKKPERTMYARHEATFQRNSLDVTGLLSSKVVMLQGSSDLEYFGLGETAFRHMQSSVTCIIHNAWRVDFNVTLSSFEPLIAGARRIIDFALGSPLPNPPHFLFVSTMGVLTSWTGGPIGPEAPILRPTSAIGHGYSESKWVAERILSKASEQTTSKPLIVRVGHVCGGRAGNWDTSGWIPMLVRSGQVLGCLPHADGEITWIPVDAAAAALIEMRASREPFLNLVHPRPVPAPPIFSAFANALRVPLVSYGDWLAALESSRSEGSDAAVAEAIENPALILLDFFRSVYRPVSTLDRDREAFGFPSASIARALAAAPVQLGNIPPISEENVASWMTYWWNIGFLKR